MPSSIAKEKNSEGKKARKHRSLEKGIVSRKKTTSKSLTKRSKKSKRSRKSRSRSRPQNWDAPRRKRSVSRGTKKKRSTSKQMTTSKSSSSGAKKGKKGKKRRKSSRSSKSKSKSGPLSLIRSKFSKRSGAAGTSSSKSSSGNKKSKKKRSKHKGKGRRRYKSSSKTKSLTHSGGSTTQPPTSNNETQGKEEDKKSDDVRKEEKSPKKVLMSSSTGTDNRSEPQTSDVLKDEKKKDDDQKPIETPNKVGSKEKKGSKERSMQVSQGNKSPENEIKCVACSSWSQVVTSRKQASRMIVIMRSAERVDRVFGSNWFLTEAPFGMLNPTDLNVPNNATTSRFLDSGVLNENPPITAIGKYSTVLAARAMYNRGISPKLIVCSPTLRAIQTGEELAKFLKAKLAIEPGLVEPLSWYRRPGKDTLDFGLDVLLKEYAIDTTNYSQIISMESLTRLYPTETEVQGLSRVDFVLRSLAGEDRKYPLVIVGHAITLAAAVALAYPQDHQQKGASSSSRTRITSFDWQMGVHMLEGDVVDQVNLGLRFPPGSVVALKQVNKGPPYLYELFPNVIPPLSYGEFYSNQPVLEA